MRDRARPCVLHFDPVALYRRTSHRNTASKEWVDRHLDQLARAHMQPVVGNEIENAKDAQDQHPGQKEGVLCIGVSAIADLPLQERLRGFVPL